MPTRSRAEGEAQHHGDCEADRRDDRGIAQADHQRWERLLRQLQEAALTRGVRRRVGEVLIEDALVGAVGFERCEAGIERGHEVGVHALVHGHTVVAARHFVGDGLQPVVLRDAVGEHRVVVDDGHSVA